MSVDRSDKGLAQNAAFVLVAELIVQATRAATIFVLAEVFAKDTFGTYVSLLALTTLLAPVSQWGMNHVGVRAVARNVPFAQTWAKVISAVSVGGLLGTCVATVVGFTLLDVRPIVAFAFGIAQLIGFNSAQASTMMTEAHHRSDVGLRINLAGGAVRLVLLLTFYLLGFDDLLRWSVFLLVGMVSWGVLSSLQVAREFGGTHRLLAPSREDLRHGFGFVFVQTSSSAIAAGYGLVAGTALFLCAPLILLILDDEKYGDSVTAVKWLAFIPLVKGLQYFPGNALTGADHHNVRMFTVMRLPWEPSSSTRIA